MNHHRARHGDDGLALLLRLPRQRRRLPHRGLHLALGGNLVRHERERQTVALLRFRRHADAVHAGDHHVAGLQIAQAPAVRCRTRRRRVLDDDHGVHALVLHFHPFAGDAHEGVVIAGGVEIFRRAAVALHQAQRRVAALGGRTADGQQLRQHVLHLLAGGRFHAQPQIRRIAVGAADAELLDFETAVRFDHLVEDLLHDVGIDQVAFGLDNFFKWHETTSLLSPVPRQPAADPPRAGRRNIKKHAKTGVLSVFPLYIACAVPYDDNDSRTQCALEPNKYRVLDAY